MTSSPNILWFVFIIIDFAIKVKLWHFLYSCLYVDGGRSAISRFYIRLEMHKRAAKECRKNAFCGNTGKSWDPLWCSAYSSFADEADKKKLSENNFSKKVSSNYHPLVNIMPVKQLKRVSVIKYLESTVIRLLCVSCIAILYARIHLSIILFQHQYR